MIIYHGTTERYLDKIRQEGILPREITGVKSNWKNGRGKGKKNLVYLSKCYPAYYASNAKKGKEKGLILKIDLPDGYDFFPDEEFLLHSVVDTSGKRFYSKMEDIDVFRYKEHWKASLDYMGTVAVKEVPKYAIKEYTIEDKIPYIFLCDASISPLNYKICSKMYTESIKKLSFKKF